MSLKQDAAYLLAGAVGIWRRRQPARGWRILMYHAVGTPVPGDGQGRYSIEPQLFAAHMRRLATGSQRQLVSLSAEHQDAAMDNAVSLTFDDGYRDNLVVAYSLLRELSIPFTIFVTVDYVRSGEPIYLSVADLRTLAADPLVTIGAHGMSHGKLADLSEAKLRGELLGSKAFLEDAVGYSIDTMSYPHGSTNPRVRDCVAETGFRIAAGSEFGINPEGSDPLSLRRSDIWAQDRESDLAAKLDGAWDWMRWLT